MFPKSHTGLVEDLFILGSQTLEFHIGVAALGTCELLFGDSTPARLMSNFFYNPRRSCSCGWWQDSVRVVFRSFDEESEVAMMT